ncbi:hypothetical protein [Frankia sp. Cppng1_Ct_nod]|uniref:hypothetical protein n=1 Tax=Frankia sp. Cppng1_Ct_nod TaxID=2897162 RepID=UPI0010417430|nr:hypothetical protein [Frankia sp. Cppng1_Ct_nod]
MVALILAFFACMWFGWAQEMPPSSWRQPLLAGAIVSLIILLLGALAVWQLWSSGSVFGTPEASRRYGFIVRVETVITAVGSAAIFFSGRSDYLAPWICLVVGVHMWPVASVLHSPSFLALGGVLIVVSVFAVVMSQHADVAASAITGAGVGSALVCFAGANAALALRARG